MLGNVTYKSIMTYISILNYICKYQSFVKAKALKISLVVIIKCFKLKHFLSVKTVKQNYKESQILLLDI